MNEGLTEYEWEGHSGTGISRVPDRRTALRTATGPHEHHRRRLDIWTRPAELLRDLIRFDTTNPPGNERACISYIEGLLDAAGIESTIRARDPERPNLIARLPGRGAAPPLLLQGHVDVVTTAGQQWSQPPVRGARARRLHLGPRRDRHEGRRRDDAGRAAARARPRASSRPAT